MREKKGLRKKKNEHIAKVILFVNILSCVDEKKFTLFTPVKGLLLDHVVFLKTS